MRDVGTEEQWTQRKKGVEERGERWGERQKDGDTEKEEMKRKEETLGRR